MESSHTHKRAYFFRTCRWYASGKMKYNATKNLSPQAQPGKLFFHPRGHCCRYNRDELKHKNETTCGKNATKNTTDIDELSNELRFELYPQAFALFFHGVDNRRLAGSALHRAPPTRPKQNGRS